MDEPVTDEPAQCHVILGHEDEGGQRQCKRLPDHPYPHDAREAARGT